MPVSAASLTAATILRVKGEVEIRRVNGAEEKAKVDVRLFEGDVVKTTPSARVKLLMAGGKNTVVLGGGTSLKMDSVAKQSSRGTSPGVKMKLTEGSVRSSVNQKYSGIGDDVFEVRTPNAVAGVRGTIFLVSYNKNKRQSTLATEKGAVEWRAGGANKMVRQGEFSAVVGARMSEIRKINTNTELRENLRDLKQVEQSDQSAVETNDPAVESSSANEFFNSRSADAETVIDNEGNIVVVEKESRAPGRNPASFNSGAENNTADANASGNGRQPASNSVVNRNTSSGQPVAANGPGGGSQTAFKIIPAGALPDEKGNTGIGNGGFGNENRIGSENILIENGVDGSDLSKVDGANESALEEGGEQKKWKDMSRSEKIATVGKVWKKVVENHRNNQNPALRGPANAGNGTVGNSDKATGTIIVGPPITGVPIGADN